MPIGSKVPSLIKAKALKSRVSRNKNEKETLPDVSFLLGLDCKYKNNLEKTGSKETGKRG
ncbi:hypothetical protein R4Z10_09555 [Niallia sp. XMNu-256]|uniref:hypothetical protein n=1 Tax=Niallia sp. XMNu-256 TaxID=3082444 RepID=UPI0030CD0C55